MKQRSTLMIITLLLSVFFAFSASAYDVVINNVYYNLNTEDKTAEVTYKNTNYNSYSGDVMIPMSIASGNIEYRVVSIGENAFFDCSGLTSITIPNSVEILREAAFYCCTGLTSITFPNSLTTIESGAFKGCSGLSSLTIPNSVTSIGVGAFSYCSGLTSVTIPNTVTSIGDNVFSDCNNLLQNIIVNNMFVLLPLNYIGHYDIPENITKILGGAFYNCSGLTSVTIPSSVKSIGDLSFLGCSSLTSVTIPNSVTSIGIKAFYGCSGLMSVALPNSVTNIEFGTFSGCSGLKSVTIPNSVTRIGKTAFEGCSSLTSVIIPNSITNIESGTFSGCSGLKSVTIPNSVTSIESSAFSGCSGLTSVTVPNSVTNISSSVFWGCTGLKSVTIGSSVTNITDRAFEGCNIIETIYCYAETAPYITYNAFTSSVYENAKLFIQDSSFPSYQQSSTWNSFRNFNGFINNPIGISPSANANSEVHYSTYSNNLYDTELQVPAGNYIKVFNVKVNSGSLELVERDNAKVACGEGVLVCTDAESVNVVKLSGYDLTPASEEVTMLKATPIEDMTITAPAGYKLFRLTYNNSTTKEGLGFYYGNADGTQVSSKIYKAYLQVPTEALGSSMNAAKGFKLGDTTGFDSIEFVPQEDAELPTYNLNGQQVDKSAKGILVKGNKKFYSK